MERGRHGRGGGVLGAVLVLAICFLGAFLLIHPDLLTIPTASILPSPNQQPPETTVPPLYDEIHARYGNKYDGYENLIRRTASGGFDTRDADAAVTGQPPAAVTKPQAPVVFPSVAIPVSPGTGTGEIESYIAQYTNDERRVAGVAALLVSTCLQEIARAHSEDMAANRFFSHENPEGQDPSARAAAHGCPTRKSPGGGMVLTGIAENIGKMPTGNVAGHGSVPDTPQAVARAQVDSWMASPGHRGNILNPSYSHLGVGTAKDASGYYLSTQDFW